MDAMIREPKFLIRDKYGFDEAEVTGMQALKDHIAFENYKKDDDVALSETEYVLKRFSE